MKTILKLALVLLPVSAFGHPLDGDWYPKECLCSGGQALPLEKCEPTQNAHLRIAMNTDSSGTYSWSWTVWTEHWGRCDATYGGRLEASGNSLHFDASAAHCTNRNDGTSEGVPPSRNSFTVVGDVLTIVRDRKDLCPASESVWIRYRH